MIIFEFRRKGDKNRFFELSFNEEVDAAYFLRTFNRADRLGEVLEIRTYKKEGA